jgi:hypothetical protein
MQKIIAISVIAVSLAAFPAAITTPSFAVDTTITALCGADGPESYKRPGGYCDQVGANNSLVESGDCDAIPYYDYDYYLPTSFSLKAPAKPLLVAEYCYDYLPAVY